MECNDLPEYRSATKYTKTCQLHCSPVYQSVSLSRNVSGIWTIDKVYVNMSDIVYPRYHSVYQTMMQRVEGLEFMLEYQHIYKYGLKYCYLWEIMFSDDCLKKINPCVS